MVGLFLRRQKEINMSSIRDSVAIIAGDGDINGYAIARLKALRDLCSSQKEVVKEVDYRIEYINLRNAPGKRECKECRGYGMGADGRGDPWVCSKCKPELKTFWDNK